MKYLLFNINKSDPCCTVIIVIAVNCVECLSQYMIIISA